ncbi:sugar phosphate isomerase/epimerase [Marinilactibacillus sp. XAAS-LB27]|uniref:sugar phosphate isomerase/epimerase family protein n=1 Tax=Marinilactibacillus sp. XAAS-LB27 TaxID=3114538 RepID=UPI002E18ED39|nr:sugar phosphate isomerase/epimerase [Marinilactibacillus sp. XAAS-LB27]
MNFPLNLGIRAHDLGLIEMNQLIEKLNCYNLKHVQFAIKKSFPEVMDTYDKLTPGLATYYAEQFNKAGIKISILGCYVNIIDRNVEKREIALNDFIKHLSLSQSFNASMVATETGSVGKGYTEENFTTKAFNEVVSSVRKLTTVAEKFGTIVAIEAGMNHPLHSAKLAYQMIQEIQSPNLKIILDCANLISIDNYERQSAVIEEALDLLDEHIVAMHIKDYVIKENKVEIVPVGTGEMQYEKILSFIKYKKPNLFVSLEATREPALEKSLQLLKECYENV